MEYEDRITITAPEGIELQYTLAGLGSRFLALLLDVLVEVAVGAPLLGLLALLGMSTTVVGIVFLALYLVAFFVYDIAFEVWGAGRTPGKRWTGIRVVMADGQPVRFGASAARNLMRIVDQYLLLGVPASIAILLTRRNQRLGDMTGGTIVVRDRGVPPPAQSLTGPASPASASSLDLTAVTASDLALIRDFLARRESLATAARERVAEALTERLRGRVAGLGRGEQSGESLLEAVATAKSRSLYGSAEEQPEQRSNPWAQ